MADPRVLERIAAWEAAGLIDAATATRLRASEADRPDDRDLPTAAADEVRPSGFSALVGPSPSIVEVFAYLGGGFLIAAWHVLAANLLGSPFSSDPTAGSPQPNVVEIVVEFAIPAVLLAIGGWVLARRRPRDRRAAGALFAVATWHVFQGTSDLFNAAVDFRLNALVASVGGVAAAAIFRRLHAAVLTQGTLLLALAVFAASAVAWLDQRLFGSAADPYTLDGGVTRVLLEIGWWLGWAIVFGLFGRWELRRQTVDAPGNGPSDGGAAARRAVLSRFVAGFTAVIGTTAGIAANGEDGRLLAPWLGDLLLLAVVGVMLAAAFRFGASVYLAPAALGIVLALSDLNESYLAQQTGQGIALLIEGVILIGVGFGGDRLRRRLARTHGVDAAPAPTLPGTETEPVAAPPA